MFRAYCSLGGPAVVDHLAGGSCTLNERRYDEAHVTAGEVALTGTALKHHREVEAFPVEAEVDGIAESLVVTVEFNAVFVTYLTVAVDVVVDHIAGLNLIVDGSYLVAVPFTLSHLSVAFVDTYSLIHIVLAVGLTLFIDEVGVAELAYVAVVGGTVFSKLVSVSGNEEVSPVAEILEETVFDAVVPTYQEFDTLVCHLAVVDGRTVETQQCVHLKSTEDVVSTFLVPVEGDVKTAEQLQV